MNENEFLGELMDELVSICNTVGETHPEPQYGPESSEWIRVEFDDCLVTNYAVLEVLDTVEKHEAVSVRRDGVKDLMLGVEYEG